MKYVDFDITNNFLFLVFGICQKRQVCHSMTLQIKKSSFKKYETLISKLKLEDFRQANKEELEKKPFSNEGIRILQKDLHVIRARIQGTDEAHLSMRSKVWSTILLFNPPSLWIMINPANTQDPIVQVIAGIDIDLDKFYKLSGPNSQQHASNITGDSFVAAKFFCFIIQIFLHTVLGIMKTKYSIYCKEGVHGVVQTYLGAVEAQGQGTLHMHMLVWLKDAPTAKVMEIALKDEGFHCHVIDFINAAIRTNINEMDMDGILSMPTQKAILYSRPINPTKDRKDSNEHKKYLARALQYHQCSTTTCLQCQHGCLRCKWGAPFTVSMEGWVNEKGE